MTEETKNQMDTPLSERKGAFFESLARNAKQIKRDRAESIAEDAEIRFKRTIEDMELDLKKLRRQRENMLDMSPDNTHSLILGKDFDSVGFVEQDIKLGVEMHNLQVKLDIARKRYEHLFGGGV